MLKVIISVLLLAFFSSVIGYQQLQATIQTPLQIADNTQFEVKKGTGFNKLCRQWQQQQWVEDCWRFQILAKLDPTLTDLKAGLYELSSDSVLNNIKKINQGQQISFSFTIIEGQALRDVLNTLSTSTHLQNDLKLEQLGEQIIGKQTHLEGWLFPDTYHYHSNDTASSLLKRAAQKMQQTLADAWQQRTSDLPYDTAYEALIMASIIEKETALASERPLIASAFINRLNTNMRLQTDPTVIYGLGEDFDGDIKRKDLRNYTPYNTYRINGLPPTPIAMPSKEAILAAVNPPKSEYVYFVAKGDGSHQFSTTLKQHNAAVNRYILNKKN
ncbi:MULTISPECIES: endolytic transglycosylase MltG [Pseudoalteromonas]|uniref:endolytic transglycosylase MltG n=1 Tax=Pseudoalteromonas TaxID=53246 RepID=UPI002354C15C|nr:MULTISPECIES: endolytic transglycosylase MltG [Pseudoalteromonas]MDN3407775.1 endolytic transglycosylase MltG [Pseudoalteromonas sp. APC 3894]MDN3415415.1 endolytic transglycosylase MltG [Pseudoalteromonas sp. APC 3227]MDN3419125.1 endolytic transglycosylase MltG [Pseudoalteromonas sp. APC 3895]MDN3422482.1 endolytic transglycosylase MltG [Pseudoalteromonas sp. APC 3896]|tara:strand:+ start:798 stop:1784 length:987 start_codon:yes stop_codon:yes gene_type:complete